MSKLVEYAEEEMRRAGLYDADSSYGGMIPESVLAMVRAHSEAGHSGGSHFLAMSIFDKVVRYQPLTPITSDPNEWTDMSDMSGEPTWQSRRAPSKFSKDGGKTWYDIDKPLKFQWIRRKLKLRRFAP